jgi:predicted nuclease with TOPRIM domain
VFNGKFGGIDRKISRINNGLRLSFKKLKDELNQHLDTINDNTNEIQTNHDYLCRLESKIDKLNERIEDIEMMFRTINNNPPKSFKVKTLTKREQEVFLALYTLEQDTEPVTYKRIAQFLAITNYAVEGYISNLIDKGVPIIKTFSDDNTFLRLDPVFREIQAKRNLANITRSVHQKINNF